MKKTFKTFAIATFTLTLCGTAHANDGKSSSSTSYKTQPSSTEQAKDATPEKTFTMRRRVVKESLSSANNTTRVLSKGRIVIVPHTSNDDITIYQPTLSRDAMPNYYND